LTASRGVSRAKIAAEESDLVAVKKAFIGFRKDQLFFSYFRCANCGLLYSPWYFSQLQLNELYAEMPDNLLGEDKLIISRTQSGYVNQLSKYISDVDSYLEVGPDIGLVTERIVYRFKPNNIILVEPNKAVHKELIENCKSKAKIHIQDSLIEVKNAHPDLIVGVHVYDHLLNPLEELGQLNQMAPKGARLVLVVHNEKSLLRKILKSKWPPFCLQHPQLYNKKTLSKLLELSGWRVVTIRRTINWFSLNHLVKTGAYILGINPKVFNFLPKIQIPFILGNMICIAEKKSI
jgi:hypothetical protein